MADHGFSDRVTGVIVGAACGDALGAGYEFGPALAAGTPVTMRGQGPFEPGEWTDDTAQMLALALAAADGALDSDEGAERFATHLLDWYYSPARLKDIGIHTSTVMREVATVQGPGLAKRFREVAVLKERNRPRSSGGNGALMRTAPVALALVDDPVALVETAMSLGALTHADPRSSQACAVWCLAIRAALLRRGPFDLGTFAADVKCEIEQWMHPEHAETWIDLLDEAQGRDPREYMQGNGYSVTTLQAAWAAITATPVPSDDPGHHFADALTEAVRGGGDADTVACVAGALLGAIWGLSAIPLQWRRMIHGWPDATDRDLVRLAMLACPRTRNPHAWPSAPTQSYAGWSGTDALAVHPFDDGVLISGIDAATGRVPLPFAPDAVVSLCRVGSEDLAWLGLERGAHVEVRLIDEVGANPNLALVLRDAARAIAAFRDEGKRVLVHCVAAQSRTPSVAAMYAITEFGIESSVALAAVIDALPNANPNPDFREALASVERNQP